MILRLLLAVLALAILPMGAYAQEDTTMKPLPSFLDNIGDGEDAPIESEPAPADEPSYAAPQSAAPKTDLSQVSDAVIIEVTKYGEECRDDDEMNKYFDCRCLASEYLDARMKLGEDASAADVKMEIRDRCRNAAGIAGSVYERCLENIMMQPKDKSPEEFCSCYANTYGKYLETWPRQLTRRTTMGLKSKAQLVCQDQRAARRIYGPGAGMPY